jgi:hypothetical protein
MGGGCPVPAAVNRSVATRWRYWGRGSAGGLGSERRDAMVSAVARRLVGATPRNARRRAAVCRVREGEKVLSKASASANHCGSAADSAALWRCRRASPGREVWLGVASPGDLAAPARVGVVLARRRPVFARHLDRRRHWDEHDVSIAQVEVRVREPLGALGCELQAPVLVVRRATFLAVGGGDARSVEGDEALGEADGLGLRNGHGGRRPAASDEPLDRRSRVCLDDGCTCADVCDRDASLPVEAVGRRSHGVRDAVQGAVDERDVLAVDQRPVGAKGEGGRLRALELVLGGARAT